MFINDQDDTPDDPAARWSVAIFLLVVVGLFTADTLTSYEPVKASALFVVFFWVPLLFLHEFAHALMAWGCGWHVHRIVIGFGPPYWVFSLFGARTEFRRIPISGYIQPIPTHMRQPRLREFLIYAAGPGSELALALAVTLLWGPQNLLVPSNHYGVIALQSLVVAALSQGFFNLVPCFFLTPNQRIANDGMGMLICWRRSLSDYEELIEASRMEKSWDKYR